MKDDFLMELENEKQEALSKSSSEETEKLNTLLKKLQKANASKDAEINDLKQKITDLSISLQKKDQEMANIKAKMNQNLKNSALADNP